jgi:hypothetical protein
MDSQPRLVTVHYFLISQRPNDALAVYRWICCGVSLVWGGGPPPGTFGLKVLRGRGFGLDLWKSYLADSALKANAR